MKTLGIIGSGDLGKQIAHYAITDNHYQNVVFFDDFNEEEYVDGFKVLGKISEIENAFNNKQFDELIIAIGYKHLLVKKEFFHKIYYTIPFLLINVYTL